MVINLKGNVVGYSFCVSVWVMAQDSDSITTDHEHASL